MNDRRKRVWFHNQPLKTIQNFQLRVDFPLNSAAKAPPFFGLGRSLKLLFGPGLLRKRPPFQKYTILCSAFPTWADRKDPCFKKIYVSLLFFAPKYRVFPVRGHSESPPFSVRGRSLNPRFLNPVRHIYTNFMFEYPPTLPRQSKIFH